MKKMKFGQQDTGRRSFLKMLGIGAASLPVLPSILARGEPEPQNTQNEISKDLREAREAIREENFEGGVTGSIRMHTTGSIRCNLPSPAWRSLNSGVGHIHYRQNGENKCRKK